MPFFNEPSSACERWELKLGAGRRKFASFIFLFVSETSFNETLLTCNVHSDRITPRRITIRRVVIDSEHVVVFFVGMESSNSLKMESPDEDIMLIETMKSIVTHEGRNESEGADEDFFLISQDQTVQYPVEETVSLTEVTLTWMNLCRICANASERMIPIFEGDGAKHDLSSKILKYLPIHVCTMLRCQFKYLDERGVIICVSSVDLLFTGIRERHSTVATMRELHKRLDSLARVKRGVPKCGEKVAGNAEYATAK